MASLASACARAVTRARQAGRPVVLAASERASFGDPLAVFGAMGPAGGDAHRFYFEHPQGGFALAAGGRALGWTAPQGSDSPRDHSARFAAVRAPLETAMAEAEVWAPEGQEPLGLHAVGGFAFFGRLAPEDWPGFAPADLALPAWLALRRGGASHALVHFGVRPADDPGAVLERVEARLADLRRAASAAPVETAAPTIRVEGLDPPEARRHWTGVVRTARDQIRAGRFRKVVLARPLDLVCTPAPDPLVLLARLRMAYPDCYTFLVDPGAGKAYLGATPERLARMDPGSVTLAALAGTFPRGATPEADAALKRLMLENPKEREEHAIVVDAIREALSGFGTLDIPAEPEVRPFKNVWHLFTPISLTPGARVSLLSLVERLHPTPAVGGLPREAALEAMRRLETFDRGWYGAPLGWLNARGEGEFAVTLRAGTVETGAAGAGAPPGASGRVRLIAGGGIVADSDPEREFEETRIKFQPLLGALGQE